MIEGISPFSETTSVSQTASSAALGGLSLGQRSSQGQRNQSERARGVQAGGAEAVSRSKPSAQSSVSLRSPYASGPGGSSFVFEEEPSGASPSLHKGEIVRSLGGMGFVRAGGGLGTWLGGGAVEEAKASAADIQGPHASSSLLSLSDSSGSMTTHQAKTMEAVQAYLKVRGSVALAPLGTGISFSA